MCVEHLGGCWPRSWPRVLSRAGIGGNSDLAWRAQVYDPATGTNVSVSTLLGGAGTFATKAEARRARERARERLRESRKAAIALAAFWERWTTDSPFARPKESTSRTRSWAGSQSDSCTR